MASTTLMVTGATGSTGGAAIDALLAHGRSVRAMVRRIDARSDALAARGVEVVVGDLSRLDDVRVALDGVAAAYFCYTIREPGLIEATAYFAQAAIERGVGAIVNMSQVSARPDATSHASQNHWVAERLLDRSGVAVTHLRPTFFAEWIQYVADGIRTQGILPLPFGDGRYAPIAAEDQGRAIAAILGDPASHAGKTYPLYGPVEMSQHDVAALLTQKLGRPIAYVPLEIPRFVELWRQRGFTDYFTQHIASVAMDCRNGLFAGTNDCVERLTGRKPIGMADYIETHRAMFA